jgi:hypothetical protein
VLLIHVKVSVPYMTDEIDADPQHLLGISIKKRGTFYFGRGGTYFSERNELGTKLKYVDRSD